MVVVFQGLEDKENGELLFNRYKIPILQDEKSYRDAHCECT